MHASSRGNMQGTSVEVVVWLKGHVVDFVRFVFNTNYLVY